MPLLLSALSQTQHSWCGGPSCAQLSVGPFLALYIGELIEPMTTVRRTLSRALFTLASAAVLVACIEDPGPDEFADEGEDEVGIEIEEEDTLPDIPDDEFPDEEPDAPTCETTTAIGSTVPPNVMLVLDKSRSMVLNTWDDDGEAGTPEVTRWSSLHTTVDTITADYELGMSLGLSLFPSAAASSDIDEACLVSSSPEVETGLGNAGAILSAIPSAEDMDLFGATPATAGIANALAHLESLEDGRPSAMILVTDGAANCQAGTQLPEIFGLYDDDLPLVVADAYERAGIPTYVVGIDITELSQSPFTNPREKLHEVALAGGVAREGELGFYDANSPEALTAALDEIASSVSCGVELGKAPSGPDQLIVKIDGQTLPRLDSCEDGDGWVYADVDGDLRFIEMCNASCDAVLDAGEVEAEFLCPPQP